MGKRSDIAVDEREVRATIPESRGRKRVSESDGRIDLDEADMEMARKAAEAGLEIFSKSKVRIETVTPATYSYYAPMPVRPPPPPPRWCDVDDEMENDPLVNLEKWKMGASHNAECAQQGDTYTEINECIEGRALREAPHVSHRCIEGLALREAPHVSHQVANYDPSTEVPLLTVPSDASTREAKKARVPSISVWGQNGGATCGAWEAQ